MPPDAMTILLACLSYANDATTTDRLTHVSPEEWRAVAALAERQSVMPFLNYRLKRLGLALPGEVAEELEQAYLKSIRRNMRLYQGLGKVLHRLREKNVAVIALKGAYLAEMVYDHIGLRAMGDVDLW